ncbi:MAG: replication initiator protein A [Lachnospiraceae bacterium]|nr:replication initiator protein A [Lachnospiraceae bacterium]
MFDYIDKTQSDQFNFIRIPRALFTEGYFSNLSVQAKVMYGILIDRMSIAFDKQWMDNEGRVYIIYPVEEMQEDINFSKRKLMDYLSELENVGLIVRKKQGNGKPNCIYVKNFVLG